MDFVAEWNAPSHTDNGEPRKQEVLGPHWIICFDSSKHLQGAGARVILIILKGKALQYGAHLNFDATNNMAKYEVFLLGLRLTNAMCIHCLLV
jgi:hypothetical protein